MKPKLALKKSEYASERHNENARHSRQSHAGMEMEISARNELHQIHYPPT